MSIENNKRRKTPQLSPVSVRLNLEERRELERRAGQMPLSRYIRLKLFGERNADWKSARPKRKPQTAPEHKTELARALMQFGQSEVAQNLSDIARVLKLGIVPASDDLIARLETACRDIGDIRELLVKELTKRG
jgi:hypothetical protein